MQTALQNRAENYSSLRKPLLSSNRKRERPHQWRQHYKTEQKTTTVKGSPCHCSAEKELNHTSEDTSTKQSRKLQQCKAAPVTVQQKKKNRPHLCRHRYKTDQKTTTVQGSPCHYSAEKELDHTSEDTAKEQSRKLQQFKATPVCFIILWMITFIIFFFVCLFYWFVCRCLHVACFYLIKLQSTLSLWKCSINSLLLHMLALFMLSDWAKRAALKAMFSPPSNTDF